MQIDRHRTLWAVVLVGSVAASCAKPPPRPPAKPVAIAPRPVESPAVEPDEFPPAQLALGRAHSCVRAPEGAVRCWGDNTKGQLGIAAGNEPVLAAALFPTKPTRLLGSGGDRTCVVDENDRVRCAGAGLEGIAAPKLENLPSGYHWRELTVSNSAICAHRSGEYEGSFLVCDANAAALRSFEWTGDPHCKEGTLCAKRYDFQLKLRGSDACLLEAKDGSSLIRCSRDAWSIDSSDRSEGDGGEKSSGEVAALTIAQLALGDGFVCGRNGEIVKCWGPGVGAAASAPKVVRAFPATRSLCAMARSLCSLGLDGRVFCAAASNLRAAEVLLPEGETGREIACGDRHACAVTSSGQIACWGDNERGQLGDGTTARKSAAVLSNVPRLSRSPL